ncbi:MAG: hypothetical protein ACK5IO_10435, partial [Bacteroidota bacterium]
MSNKKNTLAMHCKLFHSLTVAKVAILSKMFFSEKDISFTTKFSEWLKPPISFRCCCGKGNSQL